MLIGISAEHYDRFVAACDNKSPEYTILKNGCIVHDREAGYDRKMVEILCNRGRRQTCSKPRLSYAPKPPLVSPMQSNSHDCPTDK